MRRDLLDKIMSIVDDFILQDSLYCIETRWIQSEDTLVIYIDSSLHPKVPVDLLCCENIHRKIFKDEALNLELSKIIKKDFNLEVSSPGINRPLRRIDDFKAFLGSKIELKVESSKKKSSFIATLKNVDESSNSVELSSEERGVESFKINEIISAEVLSE